MKKNPRVSRHGAWCWLRVTDRKGRSVMLHRDDLYRLFGFWLSQEECERLIRNKQLPSTFNFLMKKLYPPGSNNLANAPNVFFAAKLGNR